MKDKIGVLDVDGRKIPMEVIRPSSPGSLRGYLHENKETLVRVADIIRLYHWYGRIKFEGLDITFTTETGLRLKVGYGLVECDHAMTSNLALAAALLSKCIYRLTLPNEE